MEIGNKTRNSIEMMSIRNEQQQNQEMTADLVLSNECLATAISHPHPTTQLLISSKFVTHIPEAGINPLVDAAAHIFSVMGKLKHIKWHHDLDKLHAELVLEIENFQETVKSYSYDSESIAEYIPIACYALCVTLDDIISDTPWGRYEKWDKYSLVATFIPEPPSQSSFFIILERLIRDPDIYIDVMEFMYICLNFGFKCRDNANSHEFDHEQLEQIINSLYRRIRSYRGSFSKVLSPFPFKQAQIELPREKKGTHSIGTGLTISLTILLVSALFILLFFS